MVDLNLKKALSLSLFFFLPPIKPRRPTCTRPGTSKCSSSPLFVRAHGTPMSIMANSVAHAAVRRDTETDLRFSWAIPPELCASSLPFIFRLQALLFHRHQHCQYESLCQYSQDGQRGQGQPVWKEAGHPTHPCTHTRA